VDNDLDKIKTWINIDFIRDYMATKNIPDDATMEGYLATRYQIEKGGTLQDHLDRLSLEQAKNLVESLEASLIKD